MKTTLNNKISHFVRLNLITIKLNNDYIYNFYLLIFIFLCIISSIIVRSNLMTIDLLNINITHPNMIILVLLLILTILYSIKLIWEILRKGLLAFKIIPKFIQWINEDIKDIRKIITLYYLQNIFFILLSCWILYNIFNKLNLFIENIHLFIIGFGILSSYIFFHYYPLRKFNLNPNINIFPIWVYLLLVLFFLFYMFILPFIIVNIINSEKFIIFKNEFINKCLNQVEYNKMNNDSSERTILNNNTRNRYNNSIKSSDEVRRIEGNNAENEYDNSITVTSTNQSVQPVQVNHINRVVINNYRVNSSQSNTDLNLPILNDNPNPINSNSEQNLERNQHSIIDINSITNQVKLFMDKTIINTSYSFEIKRLIIFYKILYPNCNDNEIEILNKLNQDNNIITKSFYNDKTIDMILEIIINKLQNINSLTIKRIDNGLISLLNCQLINLEEKKLIYSKLLNQITNNNLINIESITNNDLNKIKYKSLNRKIINLNINWINKKHIIHLDPYYINNGFTKTIDLLSQSISYNKDNLSIIFPRNNYKGHGPWSKFIHLYSFEYTIKENDFYLNRIIDNLNNFNIVKNNNNLIYLLNENNDNENKWLYLKDNFEYLTDSLNIINIKLNFNDINIYKLIKLIIDQPLDNLILYDSSSNKQHLIEILKKQYHHSLNSYYINEMNKNGFWFNMRSLMLDKNKYHILSDHECQFYLTKLVQIAKEQYPINYKLLELYKYNNHLNSIGFIFLNNKIDIPLVNINGKGNFIFTIHSNNINRINNTINQWLENDYIYNDRISEINKLRMIESYKLISQELDNID